MFAFFRQRAYCHLFVALALGIAVGNRWPLPTDLLVSDVLLIALSLAPLGALWWVWRDRSATWSGLTLYALLAASGYLSVSIAISLPLAHSLRQHISSEPQALIGRVASIPKHQSGHLRFLLRVETAGRRGDTPAEGLCYVYLRCDSEHETYLTDRVRLWASLSEVDPPRNHGQFNYRRYLLKRGTVLTAYGRSGACLKRLDKRKPLLWVGLARVRAHLTRTLAAGLPANLGELAISVVYGDKITDLPEDMEERFRRAGLTHILVASGTQVSLLIVLLALLFWRFTNDFTWRGMLLNSMQFAVTFAVVLAYAAVAEC